MSQFEIRDPIYGFIALDEWERDIIDHPVFQRLRRIRQLSWTDTVYPGAMHTRFEHSLGVMHVATQMYDRIRAKREDFLKSQLKYNETGLDRDRVLVRLAALLHDVGHGPFSHAAEDLMPFDEAGRRFRHEHYSAAIIRTLMRDVIDNHEISANFNISADDIADFLVGKSTLGRSLLWRELISSQLDADRADYLLRDSRHIGVAYGRYDLARLLSTLTITIDPETESPTLAIEFGGAHAAEGLILARYMMFTQVYFQHTRRAYDYHFQHAMQEFLKRERQAEGEEGSGTFPPPTSEEDLKAYLEWTDWKVLGLLQSGGGGDHGEALRRRQHYRKVYETVEVPSIEELRKVEALVSKLRELEIFVDKAEQSWYKFGDQDIRIVKRTLGGSERVIPLAELSNVVRELKPILQRRIYVSPEHRAAAENVIESYS